MVIICPYCDIEINEKLVEAEDGCCPECGTLITAGSVVDDEDSDDIYDDEFGDDDLGDEFGDDEFDDLDFDDEEFDGDKLQSNMESKAAYIDERQKIQITILWIVDF